MVFGYHNKLKFLSLQIKTVPQLEAAFAFLALVGPDSYNEVEFEEKCGVGMGHSLHQIFSS